METLFGTGFAEVRVHVSREVSSLGASAVTQGSCIYFAPGCYDPVSPAGQRLLAHELAHVVQQRTGRVRNPFGTGVAVVADPGLEAEASRMALRAGMVVIPPAVAQRSAAQPVSRTQIGASAVFPVRGGASAVTVPHRPSPLRIVPVPGAPVRSTAVQPQRTGRILPVRAPGAAVVQCSWEDIVELAKKNKMSLLVLSGLVAVLGLAATYQYLTSDTSEREILRRKLETNDFRITANLNNYKQHFGSDFEKKLNSLQPNDRWLDGGAGAAVAIREYCGLLKEGASQTVAVCHTKPRLDELAQFEETAGKKFTYLSGKYFQEFSNDDLGGTERFALITDFNGVLFYTLTLSEDLQKYLDLLENGGELYVANFFAVIDGEEEKDAVMTWLQKVKGVQVSRTSGGAFKIQRTGVPVVPRLKPVRAKMSSPPPEREFKSVS